MGTTEIHTLGCIRDLSPFGDGRKRGKNKALNVCWLKPVCSYLSTARKPPRKKATTVVHKMVHVTLYTYSIASMAKKWGKDAERKERHMIPPTLSPTSFHTVAMEALSGPNTHCSYPQRAREGTSERMEDENGKSFKGSSLPVRLT